MKRHGVLLLIFMFIASLAQADTAPLRDEFTYPLPAGSVNGTVGESGAVRTVVDTENKLSVTGGKLSSSGGKATPAWGDPGFWLPAEARVAGKMLIAEYTSTASGKYIEVGFDTNTEGGMSGTTVIFNRSESSAYFSGISGLSSSYIDVWEAGTWLGVNVLRTSGSYLFFKSPGSNVFKLMDIAENSTTTPLYPGVANYSDVAEIGFLHIPSTLWLPAPLTSDGFSAATTSDGLGHAEGVAGGLGSGGAGKVWTGATWGVAGGVLSNTPTLGEELLTNGSFTDWTGDNPDWWTVSTEDASNYVTETGPTGQCRIVSNGTLTYIKKDSIIDLGEWYQAQVDISALAGQLSIVLGSSTEYGYTSTGSKTLTKRSLDSNSYFMVKRVGATDVTFDNVSLKALTLSTLFRTTRESTPNVLASANLVITVGTQAGQVVRLDDPANPQNFVIAYRDGARVKLDSCIGGTYVNRISVVVTYVASAPLVVVADGTSYDVYYNHTKVGSTSTFSDAALDNNLYHGTFSTYSGNTVDNYRCDARGNEGQWNILDALSVMPQQPKPRIMSK